MASWHRRSGHQSTKGHAVVPNICHCMSCAEEIGAHCTSTTGLNSDSALTAFASDRADDLCLSIRICQVEEQQCALDKRQSLLGTHTYIHYSTALAFKQKFLFDLCYLIFFASVAALPLRCLLLWICSSSSLYAR